MGSILRDKFCFFNMHFFISKATLALNPGKEGRGLFFVFSEHPLFKGFQNPNELTVN